MVQLFGKPSCGGCVATKMALDKSKIPYEYRDITTDPAAKAIVDGLGYSQAPVVVSGDVHWSGFRPDRVKLLASA